MCGIAGHVAGDGCIPDVEAVTAATSNMLHRGPDGGGITSFASACLGHRRLSIIDIVESTQPWPSDDGRYCMVFNGEIYNYLELRQELEAAGTRFRSHGDTEVLLHMFIRHGADCLSRLNGMFAFAVWDNLQRKLFIGRDRLGKKPLYYACFDKGIAFASEISALRSFPGIDTSIDHHAVHDFFAYQFIGGSRSIYRGIHKLPAAHFLTFTQGKLDIVRYWSLPLPGESVAGRPIAVLSDDLTSLLDNAVKLRLRSDVPIGAFLSGGLDSSIIVATMKRLGADVETFTVGFGEESYDESNNAAEAARYYATHHHSSTLHMDPVHNLGQCLKAFGEPFADPSAIPTWHLCQHARRFATVALSGDGADELFGGYRRYYARKQLSKLMAIPAWLRHNFLYRFVEAFPEGSEYYATSLVKKMKLFSRMAKRLEEAANDLLPQTFTVGERIQLFDGTSVVPRNCHHISEFGLSNLDPVSQMILTDVQTYLPDDILVKVDRMSMAHSLEVRSPLLDYRIVEFACRLPLAYKICGSNQKYLLRESYKNILAPAVYSREKHGFAVPLGTWFRNELKTYFESLVLDNPIPEFLNQQVILQLWLKHQQGTVDNGFKLWSILAFHQWYYNRKN